METLLNARAALMLAFLALGPGVGVNVPTRPAAAEHSVGVGTGYSSLLQRRLTWPAFPIRVHFARDAGYTPAREIAAREGLDRWTAETREFVLWQAVEDPARAQVTVRFDPGTNHGMTSTRFTRRQRILSADITVGVERGDSGDIACITAHEFGHALGLDGHSNDESDLMYPSHFMGAAWRITERDLNTLAAVYAAPAFRIAGGY